MKKRLSRGKRVQEKPRGRWSFLRKRAPIGPAWLRWMLFSLAAVCMGLAVTVSVQLIPCTTLNEVRIWAEASPGRFYLTWIICTVPLYVLGALTGRLWLAGIPIGAVGLILAQVDAFKNKINGTPLELADFGLAGQAGDVAGLAGDLVLPEDFWQAAIGLCICILLLALTQRLTALKGSVRFLTAGVSLAFAVFFWSSEGTGLVAERLGLDFYTRIDAVENYSVHGLTVSLWRDAFLQGMEPPESYGEDYMRQVLHRIDELLAEEEPVTQETPNIIWILSESFFDVNRLTGLEFSADPLENFHALEEESVSGVFHSHHLGYGTGYIELSMLYGLTSLDIPPGTNICFMDDPVYQRFDSAAEQYTKTGNYTAELLHGFDDSLYNRTVTYPMLGFENLYFSEDIQNFGYSIPEGVYGGYYMRDKYFFQGMLERMKALNGQGKRAFLYGITMENHQPFDVDKFNWECQIKLSSDLLLPSEQDVARVMLEGITRADQALGWLTDQLREIDEPTIVVFYGDHRPNLFMPDGNKIYKKLGLCPTNDALKWTPEQVNDLYSTDYLIWANDPALLRGQAGTRQESSVTKLGPQLMELTGGPISRYWRLLHLVSRDAAMTNLSFYFVDGQGNASGGREEANLSPEAEELLELRYAVIYDAIYGRHYITEEMNLPPGD